MSKKYLLKYAQEAFDIDDETHNKLMEEVKDEKVSWTEYVRFLVTAHKLRIRAGGTYFNKVKTSLKFIIFWSFDYLIRFKRPSSKMFYTYSSLLNKRAGAIIKF